MKLRIRYLLSNLDAQGDLSSPKLEYMEAGYKDVLMDQVIAFPYWVPVLAVNIIKSYCKMYFLIHEYNFTY